jgi:hypothetical protein
MKRVLTVLAAVLLLAQAGLQAQTNTMVFVSSTAGTPVPAVGPGYVVVASSHADINVSYNTNTRTFSLDVRNEATGVQYTGTNTVVYAVTNQRTSVPSGAQWSFLGPVGGTFWSFPSILNSSTTKKSLYLGWSGYGVSNGIFTGTGGGRINLRVQSIENLTAPGTGQFYAYETSGGSPVFQLSSSNGYNNSYELPAGGHSHVNLALTAPGMFRVWFVASGTLVATGETVESQPLPLYFGVEQWQIPSAAITYNAWRDTEFNPQQAADPLVSGPEADPDNDGFANAEEFAFGGDPLVPDASLLTPRLERVSSSWILTIRQRTNASGLTITPETTASLQPGFADWRADLLTPHGQPRNVAEGIDEFAYLLDGGLTERAFLRVRTQLTSP